MSMIKDKFKATGMVCDSCEKIIAKAVLKLPGVKSVDVDYVTEKVEVSYDSETISKSKIREAIEEKGYVCKEDNQPTYTPVGYTNNQKIVNNQENKKQGWLGWTFAALGFLLFIYFAWQLYGRIELPQLTQNMGYGLLFVVGLLTGFHCVGMCGGFVVSYTTKGAREGKKAYKLHASYGIGKTISYTIMGSIFGLIGSIVAFTPFMRGFAGIIAGLFLVIYGLKMLNIFPALRKFRIKIPTFINKFVKKEEKENSNHPLIIGLLNGLMIACGPLQAIYIMAAGTGSMIEGAKMLFVFGLGTLPVMLGFGYLTSIISKKSTHKILKASGIIVMILGIIMINRGLALTGSGYDLNTLSANIIPTTNGNPTSDSNTENLNWVFKDGYQEIRMEVNRYGWSPDKFVLKKDVPVKWIIDGKELNGCNNAIQVPKYNLNFKIKQGLQTIEFTPTESGTVSWSCWMGMIPGVFVVQDEVNPNSAQESLDTVQVPKGGSCGAGGGGCGCGG
ncbi:heavy metal transporter [Candidatus Woesearchaeota archaeon CG_4_10_14_0_2_um_filter_33_13]|nr:MAG: heavy metal transporter [Candidatus Woesearchaeota archaeon CG_4_10_14_0_2_um_filter_33_13]